MASTPLSPLALDMQDILTELDIDRENDPDPEEPLPRSTSDLESFQNHILMYASKRFVFSFEGYKTRCQLAAIDYIEHLDRPEKKSDDGSNMYHRIYSKVTNHWRAFTLKVAKEYDYIPTLIGSIIGRFISGRKPLRSKVKVAPSHPRNIRATTSKCSPQPTSEIVSNFKSRFN